ncbi:MAG: hypothetical protein Q9169_000837 [Polycauliona sp. 2 TL-2023]
MLCSKRRRRPARQEARTLTHPANARQTTSLCVTKRLPLRPRQWQMVLAVNETRALRITEIMTEFQSIQRRIAEYSPNPSPDEYFEEGYEVLRQCRAEAQAVLVAPYPLEVAGTSSPSGESEKRQLQR